MMLWLLLALSVVGLMVVTIAQPNVGWGGFGFVLREMILPNFIIILPLTLTMRYYRHSQRMSKRYFTSILNRVVWIVAVLTFIPVFLKMANVIPSFLNGVVDYFFPVKPLSRNPRSYTFLGINIQTWIWMISATLASVLLSLGFSITQRRLPASKVNKGVMIRTKAIRWFYVVLELLLWRWFIVFVVLISWVLNNLP
ncbi:hypothetical protein [Entomospira culicis]|nr:hypothetical protein [Entomospira culicis]WDI37556.1 hypothetical protein PVA46_01850 [Entomospira culicis]